MKLAPVTAFRARAKRATRAEIHAYWRRSPIVVGSVLYESFSGNGMLCNPEAIFRELLASRDLAHLTHIWALSDSNLHTAIHAEFADSERVRFVRYGSPAYIRALATSEYLVNNATFPPDFSKRPGQTYLNTWHGTPLKQMGYDIPHGALEAANTMRNFVSADYLLSANSFMTEQMYLQAYKLDGIFRGTIIEEGYPRIDRQKLTPSDADAVRARLVASGIPLGDRKIILYAPTWKGTSFRRPQDDVEELAAHVAELQGRVDSQKYLVLLKTHQIAHRFAKARPELRRILVSNEVPTNVVLGVTDVLITDYSSIFFDFLATGRPVLFFTPDLSDYAEERGLYLETDKWPGPLCRTMDELAAAISQVTISPGTAKASAMERPPAAFAERYASAARRFCSLDDGRASRRVVDIVFRGKTEGYRLRSALEHPRPSILMYLGGMMNNGITTSALNLLNNIDHDRVDVSVIFAQNEPRTAPPSQRAINPAVRQFPRVGGMNGSKLTHLRRHLAFRLGHMELHDASPWQRQLWDDEWVRCFGNARFDYVVDFSGYGPFWSVLLQHSPPAIRSIWMHNDMEADAHREIGGRKPLLRSLSAVFRLYPQFDHLVSVSPALSAINRAAFDGSESAEKFRFALNTVDVPGIQLDAIADLRESTLNKRTGTSPEWVDRLLNPGENITFVTVGRLSPEKNQTRLIKAFAAVHAEHPETRLLIVGDGPLFDELDSLITRLGLSESVVLTGQQKAARTIMANSDCFVLSSDYEGQPMVILEALVLGLPIVTVDFGSGENALPKGGGLMVPQSVEGLAAGMESYLRGEVPPASFDPEAYNAKAVQQFYSAIGLAGVTAAAKG